MRGIFVGSNPTRAAWRFNPAYAGNISSSLAFKRSCKVQPRVCGEYFVIVTPCCHFIGSTPRMRGIYDDYCCYLLNGRFNPAYAGNIGTSNSRMSESKVQPRVCGEYQMRKFVPQIIEGSTPRMRGIFEICLHRRGIYRFNPAYAGNMVRIANRFNLVKVQPRVCGEYTKKIMK